MKIAMLICFTIVICGCSSLEEIYDDPCTYKVGDVIRVTVYGGGYTKYITMNITGCEAPVVLTISGKPIQIKPGDTLKLKVTKVRSPLSYIVKRVK